MSSRALAARPRSSVQNSLRPQPVCRQPCRRQGFQLDANQRMRPLRKFECHLDEHAIRHDIGIHSKQQAHRAPPFRGANNRFCQPLGRPAPRPHSPMRCRFPDKSATIATPRFSFPAERSVRLASSLWPRQRRAHAPWTARHSAPATEARKGVVRLWQRRNATVTPDRAASCACKPVTDQSNTTVLFEYCRMRRSRCQRTARDRTMRSTSRPFSIKSARLSRCDTRVTSCSMMGPSSSASVT